MSAPQIAVVCPACDTRTTVAPAEIARTLTRHNNLQHGGDAVASVAGGHVDRLGVRP